MLVLFKNKINAMSIVELFFVCRQWLTDSSIKKWSNEIFCLSPLFKSLLFKKCFVYKIFWGDKIDIFFLVVKQPLATGSYMVKAIPIKFYKIVLFPCKSCTTKTCFIVKKLLTVTCSLIFGSKHFSSLSSWCFFDPSAKLK